MKKVKTLDNKHCTPEFVLADLWEQRGEIKHIVVSYETKDGFLETYTSYMGADKLSLLSDKLKNRVLKSFG